MQEKLISVAGGSGSGRRLVGLPSNRPGKPDWLPAAMETSRALAAGDCQVAQSLA